MAGRAVAKYLDAPAANSPLAFDAEPEAFALIEKRSMRT